MYFELLSSMGCVFHFSVVYIETVNDTLFQMPPCPQRFTLLFSSGKN